MRWRKRMAKRGSKREQRSGQNRRNGEDRRSGSDRRDPGRQDPRWQGEADRRSGEPRRVRHRRSGVDRRGYSPFTSSPDKIRKIPLDDEPEEQEEPAQ
jgi:hypothetical protein